MKQEKIITIPARNNIPEASIYTEVHTQHGQLRQRDVILLVPGGPGNEHSTYCNPPEFSIADALLPYVDVILFDPRGCGKSSQSLVKYCTLAHYIEDIEKIREHFKIPAEQFILFGQSYGAIAALGYATEYQEELKKLFLIGGAASSECLQEAQENLSRIGTPEQKKWGEKIFTGTFTGTTEEFAEYYEIMGPLYSYSFKPGQPTPALTYNVEILNFGFGSFLKNFDFRPKLSRIKCPTLLLWGKDDWILDKKQAAIIHKALPNSKLKIYQHCSHMLWIDQWERFLQDAINFLKNSQ